jgi:predicted GIY-YIG superfamily endonuclease
MSPIYINDAIAREKWLKSLVRSEKDQIIGTFNPSWTFLNGLSAMAGRRRRMR